MRDKFIKAINMNVDVFWDVTPCSLGHIYQCCRRSCCVHHQGRWI